MDVRFVKIYCKSGIWNDAKPLFCSIFRLGDFKCKKTTAKLDFSNLYNSLSMFFWFLLESSCLIHMHVENCVRTFSGEKNAVLVMEVESKDYTERTNR